MKLYLLPGLGTDERLFRHQRVLQGFEVEVIRWIEPSAPEEPIEKYAQRLSEKIDTRAPFMLGGVSFGGIMAIELSTFLHPQKIILISSIKNKNELPWYLQSIFTRTLHSLIPAPLLKWLFLHSLWMMGKMPAEEKALVRSMMNAFSPRYFKWSSGAVIRWQRAAIPSNFLHLHGSHDLVFPKRFINDAVIISRGGHGMVLTRAEEVNRYLEQIPVSVRT